LVTLFFLANVIFFFGPFSSPSPVLAQEHLWRAMVMKAFCPPRWLARLEGPAPGYGSEFQPLIRSARDESLSPRSARFLFPDRRIHRLVVFFRLLTFQPTRDDARFSGAVRLPLGSSFFMFTSSSDPRKETLFLPWRWIENFFFTPDAPARRKTWRFFFLRGTLNRRFLSSGDRRARAPHGALLASARVSSYTGSFPFSELFSGTKTSLLFRPFLL